MEEIADTLKWVRKALKRPDDFDIVRKLEQEGCIEMHQDRGRWKWRLTAKGRELSRILQQEENDVHEGKLQDQEGDA